ncbi:MAG: TolC family protein [Saprospiraceae bacterium]|nr:TolC family protein [Saprospiraceae bacterium]
MFRRNLLSTLILLLFVGALSAQDSWSLQQCLEYARQNNISVKQAQATIQSNELSLKQSQFNRLPSVNANASYGRNFGLSLDYLTNSFQNQSSGYSSIGASAGVTVFAGNQINNGIKQNKMLLEASKLDASSTVNTLALNVATAYLNILLGEEQLANARKQLELTQAQLDQIDRLIRAGSRPENERYDLLAQIARNEQTIIDAENTISIGYLNLKQLMNVDQNTDIRIQRPEVNAPTENPDEFVLNEVYTSALGTQPQIRATDLRLEGAQVGVDLARGALYPTLSIFGNLDTRYSTEGRRIVDTRIQRAEQTIYLDDVPYTFGVDQEVNVFDNNPYFDQLRENFGQSFGVSLRIPIFNNLQNVIGVQRAQVTVLTTEVQNQQVRQQLKTDIQQAIASARAAKRSYDAALRSVDASQIAFDNAQTRFELGALNTFDYTTARNNLDQAQISLIRAKYQYFFNVKVVEFYLGREIKID